MNDEQIIELYWNRDESAIPASSARYGAYCLAIAGNILHSREDAEECVNDTWLRAWKAIPPQRPRRLKLYLAKITRDLAFDRYRRQTAGKRGGGETEAVLSELGECLASGDSPESALQAAELNKLINAFLRGLRPRDRDIFLRRYFYVEPTSEIARRYGLKEGSVLTVLSRARRGLKAYLQQEGYII